MVSTVYTALYNFVTTQRDGLCQKKNINEMLGSEKSSVLGSGSMGICRRGKNLRVLVEFWVWRAAL